jgi:hypothetical protein
VRIAFSGFFGDTHKPVRAAREPDGLSTAVVIRNYELNCDLIASALANSRRQQLD